MCSATISPHPSARNPGVPTTNRICFLMPPAVCWSQSPWASASECPSLCPGWPCLLAFPEKAAVSAELCPGGRAPTPGLCLPCCILHGRLPDCIPHVLSLKASSPVPWASQVILVVKNPPANEGDVRDVGSDPWVGKIPWRRAWQPTPGFLPGESYGQRNLVG